MVGWNFQLCFMFEIFQNKRGTKMRTFRILFIWLQKQPNSPNLQCDSVTLPSKSIFFPLNSELVLWLAFTNRRQWRWLCASSQARSQETCALYPLFLEFCLCCKNKSRLATWKMRNPAEQSRAIPCEASLEQPASGWLGSWSQVCEQSPANRYICGK